MLAAIDKMHVSVIEPRQQQLALRIDDPGLWSVPGIDFSGAAHGHNAIAQHGHGLVVEGHDAKEQPARGGEALGQPPVERPVAGVQEEARGLGQLQVPLAGPNAARAHQRASTDTRDPRTTARLAARRGRAPRSRRRYKERGSLRQPIPSFSLSTVHCERSLREGL